MTPRHMLTGAIAIAAGIGAFLLSDAPLAPGGGFMTRAEARIGRPLTPMSYAGVARRTTRRAVAGAAAVGAYAYTAPGCVQIVDSYGRVTTRCP